MPHEHTSLLSAKIRRLRSVGSRNFPPNLARLMLLGCALLWGTSYLVAKLVISVVGPNWVMACRTLIAACVMLLLFRRVIVPYLNRAIVVPALVVGVTYFVTLELQIQGLVSIDPGRSAFLSAGYCVVMPFAAWMISHTRPQLRALVAAVICLLGVGFVSLKEGFSGFAFGVGDWLSVASAVAYAYNVMFLSVWGRKFHPIAMTFVQFVVAGVGFVVCALILEPLPNASWLDAGVVGGLLFLILGATMLGQIFQNIGVAHLPAAQASIIMSLESVFSVIISAALYGEQITVSSLIGFALIFTAVIISQVHPRRVHIHVHRPHLHRLRKRKLRGMQISSNSGGQGQSTTGSVSEPAVASVEPTVPTPAVPLG